MPGATAPWGWHQLDDRWARRLVVAAGVRPGDLVLDVGAGTGAITRRLVAAGARVVAVELEPGRAAALRARFAGDPVTVVSVDGADLRLPRRPFRVVANPPFGITTALLRRLTSPRSQLIAGALVVPGWAAGRWTAGRGAGGPGTLGRFAFAAGPIPTRAFRPPPPGRAAVLSITRR